MNIVILNHYAGSLNMGMEYRPYYLAKEMIKKGHRVYIVAGTYSHIRQKNIEQKKAIEIEDIEGITYIWIKTVSYKGNGIKRIISMLQYTLKTYRLADILKSEKIDAVVASSTYPLDNFPAKYLAKKNNAKYIYEVHDLWPLSPQELGGYSKWHPFVVIMQIAENYAYRHVDKVISILPCAEEHMIQHGLKKGKFVHIPNGVYLPEMGCVQQLRQDILDAIPTDKIVVGYCGTLGVANALDKLVEAAKITENSNPNIFYAIVGKGPEKENLLDLIHRNNLSNIAVFDSIPKKEVQSFLQICDIIIIIIWNNSKLYQYGISPNKLFDYMYSGKPIIQAVKAGNDIVQDARCGYTIDANPNSIVEAIEKIIALGPEKRSEMGNNGYKYVVENHDYTVLADKFMEVVKK